MPFGPGAEEGEHLLRAFFISSKEMGVAFPCGESLPLDGGGFWEEEVLEKRVVYGHWGVSSRERWEVRGLSGGTYCLAVQIFWGVVLARKSDQYEALARFIALK